MKIKTTFGRARHSVRAVLLTAAVLITAHCSLITGFSQSDVRYGIEPRWNRLAAATGAIETNTTATTFSYAGTNYDRTASGTVIIPVYRGRGVSFFGSIQDAVNTNAVVTFGLDLSYDGTNWTTTQPVRFTGTCGTNTFSQTVVAGTNISATNGTGTLKYLSFAATNPVAKWQQWNIGGTQVAVAASKAITSSGGGGGTLCTYAGSYGKYWRMDTVTGSPRYIRVAKPSNIRTDFTSEAKFQDTYTYSYGLTTTTTYPEGFTRSSTRASDSFVEYQILNAIPQSGWQMSAQNTGATGVTIEAQDHTDHPSEVTTGDPVTYLDPGTWGLNFFAPIDQTPINW